ncbi:MAG: hypothetical protein ACLQQB_04935 [Solirubrobacteraceae bacterium]
MQAIRGFEEIRCRIFAIRIEFLVYAIGIDREQDPQDRRTGAT